MITVRTEYQARFREIARVNEETFQLEQPLVSELAKLIVQKHGPLMEALLIDPNTKDLNNNGTVFLDTKGRRICITDTLDDGEVVTFMVAIAGG